MLTKRAKIRRRLIRIWETVADYSFVRSGCFYSASSNPLLLRGAPDYSIHTLSELTPRSAIQATASEGLAQGPYVAAKVGASIP